MVSQFFQVADEVVWNPSKAVAALFLRSAESLKPETELPTGIGPMRDDECSIDLDTFTQFIDALLTRYERSNHFVWRSLTEGFIATSLVLVERAGGSVASAEASAAHAWADLRRSHSQAMNR